MAVTFLVSKCAYLNSQRLYRPISRTFSQVTFGASMTLESRKKSSPHCVLGIFGINQGPDFHKSDTYSTWTAHPSRLLGCAVPCRPLASFAVFHIRGFQNHDLKDTILDTFGYVAESFDCLHILNITPAQKRSMGTYFAVVAEKKHFM